MSKKTSKMGNLKYLIFAIAFSLIIAFTFWVYEPLVMYAGNIDEFWFDGNILVQNMLLPFLLTFGGLTIFFLIMYMLTKKNLRIFYIVELIFFAGFIYLYIHGNFLTAMLPTLYGDNIDWTSFVGGHVISVILLVVIIVLLIVGVKKLKIEKTTTYAFYATLVFVVMMLVSFGTTLLTPGLFVDKEVQPVVTTKNIRRVSFNKNFYIFLVDCTDSQAFNEYIEEKYSDDFTDFTYFGNSAPGYSLTRDSIPLILTGRWNKNEKQFNDFSTEAFDNSNLFARLKQEKYSMSLFTDSVIWNSKEAMKIDNMNNKTKIWDQKDFVKQESKYILYKYLPFPLKAFSKIESMDFSLALRRDEEADELYNWENLFYYNNVLLKDVEKTDDKVFQFVHVEGSHAPYNMDEELNIIEDGTYDQKIGAAAKMADLAIERLKKAGVFDDSIVVVMADHGWYTRDPVLYIKGLGEEHKEMIMSDKQISWGDLSEAFIKLIDGVSAEEAFSDIPDGDRERYFYVNPYYDKEPMIEWKINGGKSYDPDNWVKTGIEYPYPVN